MSDHDGHTINVGPVTVGEPSVSGLLGAVVEMNPPWGGGHIGRIIDVEPPGPHYLSHLSDVTLYVVDLGKRPIQTRWTGPLHTEEGEPYFRVLSEEEAIVYVLAGNVVPPPASDEGQR